MPCVNELCDGEKVYEQFLVVSANKCVNNVGSPYLNIVLQDKTGTIDAKLWSATNFDIETFKVGNIVNIDGTVNSYNGKLQVKIHNGEVVNPSMVDIKKFALGCPISTDILEKKLDTFIANIKDEEIHLLVDTIIKENRSEYVIHSAAVRNHHEHMSGLLLHSINIAETATFVADYYNNINKDMLVAGAILHDVGKIIEISGPVAPRMTTEGRLVGHISIMHAIVHQKCLDLKISDEKRILIEHMILAHHGQYDYGSPVLPLTKEALLLNILDDLDAKMNTLEKALSETNEGEFTDKIFPLENRAFYKPKK